VKEKNDSSLRLTLVTRKFHKKIFNAVKNWYFAKKSNFGHWLSHNRNNFKLVFYSEI